MCVISIPNLEAVFFVKLLTPPQSLSVEFFDPLPGNGENPPHFLVLNTAKVFSYFLFKNGLVEKNNFFRICW